MKKFMKAIAFVTVMCMALSTVAFATTTGAELDATVDKQVNVTVAGAGANEQVALYIVAKDGTTASDPLYIDQKPANESGVASFVAPIADETVTEVEVYVGYATYANANPTLGALHVDTVSLERPITEVTVVKGDTKILQGTENLIGDQQIGAGVAIKLDVEAPENVAATKMIWAIRYTENGVPKVKYSDPISNINEASLGFVVTGSVTLGFAFLNGFNELKSDENDIASVNITAVDVILLFEGANNFRQEVLTNPQADAGNKKPTTATN